MQHSYQPGILNVLEFAILGPGVVTALQTHCKISPALLFTSDCKTYELFDRCVKLVYLNMEYAASPVQKVH